MTDKDREYTRRELIERVVPIGIGSIVAGIVTYEIFHTVPEAAEEFQQRCDEDHGEGEWVLVPANRSERRFFDIGDTRVCVHEDSERAQEPYY